jgi:hypothetical protein
LAGSLRFLLHPGIVFAKAVQGIEVLLRLFAPRVGQAGIFELGDQFFPLLLSADLIPGNELFRMPHPRLAAEGSIIPFVCKICKD